MSAYETVVGLEIHVELATDSKVFCGCTTRFGGEPNTHVCPVCMGLPGALPVLNEKAVRFALQAGLAMHCDITQNARFDRKHYFYPDLPKAFQISQLYLPLCRNGWVEAAGKRVRIHEIHMEEDAGKLVHDPWTDQSLVDYNRCGVPLIEIVSEPDMRTPDEVVAYVQAVRAILMALGVSDCRMQEGSLRADVNLSVRPLGSDTLGTRTEMKNLNSIKSIARAVAAETQRQIEVIETGRAVVQQTRRWDDNKDSCFAMRSKEDAHDYRYFPEPDLPPMAFTDADIRAIRDALPELPDAKRERYPREYGLSAYDTDVLLSEKRLYTLFEEAAVLSQSPKDTANWLMGEVLAMLKERGQAPDTLALRPEKLARVIRLVRDGVVNRSGGREALGAVWDSRTPGADDVDACIEANGLAMVKDDSLLQRIVGSVMQEQADSVAKYRAGNEKVFGFLMGQAMKALAGKGDPAALKQLLEKSLKG